MVLAAYLTTALVVGASGGYLLLRDAQNRAVRRMFSMAMWMLILVAPLQILAGDQHGLNTLEHQPVKLAAIEAHFESEEGGMPLILFGWPDQAERTVHYALKVPKLGSLILTHSLTGTVPSLEGVADEDIPPVAIVFWSFRLMVALGFAMLGLGLWAAWARWRGFLFHSPWLHRAAIVMGPAGFVALLAGWVTTEVGRQPWTIYGLLRTAESRSPLDMPAVAASLTAFVVVYFFVFGAGAFYLMRLLRKPPAPADTLEGLAPSQDMTAIAGRIDTTRQGEE